MYLYVVMYVVCFEHKIILDFDSEWKLCEQKPF